jgi:hypothetical protein
VNFCLWEAKQDDSVDLGNSAVRLRVFINRELVQREIFNDDFNVRVRHAVFSWI